MGHYESELQWISAPPASDKEALNAAVLREAERVTDENVYVWFEKGARFFAANTLGQTVIVRLESRDVQVMIEWEGSQLAKAANAVLLKDLKKDSKERARNPDYAQMHRLHTGEDWIRAASDAPTIQWALEVPAGTVGRQRG